MQQKPRQEGAPRRRRSAVRKIVTTIVVTIGVIFLLISALLDPFLNRYIKPKIERAIAAAHPGSILRIGSLEYNLWRNRFRCRAANFTRPNEEWTASVGHCSLSQVRWTGLISGKDRTFGPLRRAVLDCGDIRLTFAKSQYAFRCRQFKASLGDSDLEANDLEVHPSVPDEEFFAARAFRRARLGLKVPRCTISGLDGRGLLRGEAFCAQLLQINGATLDSFINRDKPLNPDAVQVSMINDALAAIRKPLEFRNISIENSRITLRQRLSIGKEPGVMPFEAVRIHAKGIGNRGEPGATMEVEGEGRLMDAATLRLRAEIPVSPSGCSFRYSGSLDSMDLTRLNPFLTAAARTRMESGMLYEAAFEADVKNEHARGTFQGTYDNLRITFLDRETGSERGIVNRLKTFVADSLIIHTSNLPEKRKSLKVGTIDYARKPNDKFFRFAWLAVRGGMFDLLGIASFVPPPK